MSDNLLSVGLRHHIRLEMNILQHQHPDYHTCSLNFYAYFYYKNKYNKFCMEIKITKI